jgi:hypothetical protein
MSLRRSVAPIGIGLAALSLSACGGSSHRSAHVPVKLTPTEIACTTPTRMAMATYLHVAAGTISEAVSTGNNDMPQCTFRARLSSGNTVGVLVNVDNAPSPYFRVLRTVSEDAQGFPKLDHAPPANVENLGLQAAWLPQYPDLIATDGYRLITATVTWRHEPQRDDRVMAIAMTRPYLHTPHGAAAAKLAKDYP